MKIKVEPYLMKKGNRLAKAAIEFSSEDGVLAGFHLVGFTICEDADKGMFVLFPASIVKKNENNKPFFFLRPGADDLLQKLQDSILDVYESMTALNRPRLKQVVTTAIEPEAV
jgi:DNA-binding cell septation regulator SpoVG